VRLLTYAWPGICLISYSGDDFYNGLAKTGPPYEVQWAAKPAYEAALPTRPIVETDFLRITAADIALIKSDLALPATTTTHRFAVLPDTRNYCTRARIARYDALKGAHIAADRVRRRGPVRRH
jgi:hypothetical protein